jgi:hypothetical protein
LASSIAWSTPETRMTGITGPKVSSRMTPWSGRRRRDGRGEEAAGAGAGCGGAADHDPGTPLDGVADVAGDVLQLRIVERGADVAGAGRTAGGSRP